MTVPVTPDGDVIFIGEPTAYQDGALTLGLPGGAVESGETLTGAANRELQEEIGLMAARLDYLGEVYPWVKYMDAKISLFVARDFSPSQLHGDEVYDITQETHPLASFERLMQSSRLTDASVIAALYMARQFLVES
jgi:ADP-ribose pyrophosphatase